MSASIHVDLLSPEFKTNPYPHYARLRAGSPVHRVTLQDGRALWLITRYDDVVAVCKDPRFIKSWNNAMTPEQLAVWPLTQSPFTNNMLNLDPPDHTRLRALVHKAFTAPLVERLRGRIQEITDQLIDAVKARGQMDLVADFAFPLPILVIGEMLGLPPEDRDRIRHWSNNLLSVGIRTHENMQEMRTQIAAFTDYLRDTCEERRKAPGADLISALLAVEEEGQKLSSPELIAMVFLLLVAGYETTANLLGNGTLALLLHPAELAKLQADPSLIKSAIEEFLRFDGPVETSTQRFAREDIEYGGQLIRKGEEVRVVIAGADRDPAHFSDPDQLDITRADNKHLAFGHGIHFCVGAPLARLEGQIGIGTLIRRIPDLRLAVAPETIRYWPTILFRSMQSLPVTFSPQT